MPLASRISATLNFAGDRSDGGRFCNTDASRSSQTLAPCEISIIDARTSHPPPALGREGFVLAHHPAEDPQWFNEAWVGEVYGPSCVELVKRITGAERAVSLHHPIKRIADPAARGRHLMTTEFVHLDLPRELGRETALKAVEAVGESFKRATLYNIWKAITPAPQDQPLAVADRRTIPPDTHVIGMTVTDDGDIPYVIIAPSPEVQFYYFSDMSVDESIVFTSIDFDAANPLGCAHSAFAHPGSGIPRSSIEARVIAILE